MNRQEAINIVKKNWPDSSFTSLKEALEFLIPELMNTDDEKIKEAIIKGITHAAEEGCFCADNYSVKECVAWVEKQGSQILANSAKTCKDEQKSEEEVDNLHDYLYGEQKPAWSDEDERMYNVVHDLAWKSYKTSRQLDIPTFGIINDWLKSLKDRIKGE